ncbi:MAG TPA: hypothetical protein VNB94_13665 [Mycobacteriales bacterium]|nr:hypothetical protein [Mycobacteriales bacterium]
MKLSVRTALLAAAASALVFTNSAAAAPNTLTLTDVKGDANAINGQGLQPGVGDRSGPVQKADSDIVSLTLASTRTMKKVEGNKAFTCTGFTATLELAAPAGSNASYRVTGVGVVNTNTFWLQYATALGGVHSIIRYSDGSRTPRNLHLANPAALVGNKVILTVTEADLKGVGENLRSFTLSAPGADTRTATQYTVPAWDTLDGDSSKSFTPCA